MKLEYFVNKMAYLNNEIRNFRTEKVFLTKTYEEGRASQERYETRKEEIEKEIEKLSLKCDNLIRQAEKEKLFEVKLCDLYEELKKVCPPSKSKVKFPAIFITQKNNVIRTEIFLEKERHFRFYTKKDGQNLSNDKKYEFAFPNLLININPASICLQDKYFGKAVLACVKTREKQLEEKKKENN